ncbi:enoyl-CoA hydratase/isomerase family protein [Phytohabitans kaempferiae]|uniref:Enoyl-CoA hydratase/isomerase family protein n=1 Tax=Phytohabitans kaempferiae TaxID=1620943 RepID=A0ABV6MGC8_9ACTN
MTSTASDSAEELIVERDGAVVILTLNRPHRMNALGEDLHHRLQRVWRELSEDPECRAVVVTGAGERAFCTGMDLAENARRGGVRQDSAAATDVRDAGKVTALRNGSLLPVVVAVNGVCAGAGLHFVADGDVVIAADRATFTDTHVSVGQVAALEPILLAQRIGAGNALRLAVMGRALRLSATEALAISLVHEVVPQDRLRERALQVAHAIAANSPAAVRASKLAIWRSLGLPPLAGLQAGWELVREHWGHPDSKEGPKAFMEKRQPSWAPSPAGSVDVLSH